MITLDNWSQRIPYEVFSGKNVLITSESFRAITSKQWSEFWQLHTSAFVQGDAFDLVPLLPPNSIDLIITSPPYWGQRTYGNDHNWGILDEWRNEGHTDLEVPTYEWYRSHGGALGLEPIPDWYIQRLTELFLAAQKALKPRGSLWVNLGDTYYARWSSIRDKGRQGLGNHERIRRRTPMGGYRQEKQLLMLPARFAVEMQKHRWILRNDVIWYKPNVPPRPEKDRLRLSHEHLFHFVKRPREGRASYYYDLNAVEPEQNDVVTYNVKQGSGGHTATFPDELIGPRIVSSCPPDGVVLDPFCGVGTAITCAVHSGRKGIGFDLVRPFLLTSLENSRGSDRVNGKGIK